MSNLPSQTSSGDVKQFFDKYYDQKISFPANQIDAVVGFFLKNGFDIESARSTGIVLLNQAKADNVNVFELIDTLKTLTDVQLSQVVAQILNAYREKVSLLGYRIAPLVDTYESRNILV
jgi:S-adenosylmethionine:diacylglycerol 3-amino-3-carboxypropyl transferase